DQLVANPADTDTITDSPSINAKKGWILLRVGDNVTLGGLRLSPDFTGTVSFTSAGNISSSDPAFSAAAFSVGQTITVSRAGGNSGSYLIDKVTRSTSGTTLHVVGSLTNASNVQDVTVTTQVFAGLSDALRISENTQVIAGLFMDIHGDYNAFGATATQGGSDL